MSTTHLPSAIRTFIDATNSADSEAFVAAFTPDAHLYDWGRTHRGREASGTGTAPTTSASRPGSSCAARRRATVRTPMS
jgi:hypothetical protein